MKRFLIILFMMTANARAGNPDTIRACSDVGYTKNRDLNNCYKSGVAGDVIIACRKIGARDIKDIDECITSGASHEKIMDCASNSKDLMNFNNCIKTTTI